MKHVIVAGVGVFVAAGLTACIDEDYDLSKDIDMTVQIGSEGFTLPASDTAPCTLTQILDLEQTSSIKAVAEGEYGLSEGDYALVQNGESAPSHVSIAIVGLDRLKGSASETELDEFRSQSTGRTTVDVDGTPTIVDIEDSDITREIVALKSADVEIDIDFSIGFSSDDFSGNIIIEPGYKAVFDPSWTLEITDARTASFLAMSDSHTAVFTREMTVAMASELMGRLRLVHVDFDALPDQG
ncbi:MAG: hypothetical protein K2G24_09645, partial [Muribaculaceae bacterium]|nr:hypothetical protein [Muribaculaceae bacterium]